MQVDDRAEAARDRQQVTGEGGRSALELALTIHPVNLDAVDGLAAACFHHHLASQNRQAQVARPFTERAIGHGSGVHHRHRRTGLVQSECRVVGAIVVGENHRLPTRQHGVTPDVGGDGRRQHHTRQVVVGKDQGTLMGASGQHHLLGAYLPQPLAHWRHATFKVVATALGQRQKVVVLVAEHRGSAQNLDLGHGAQPTQGIFDPNGGRQIVHHGIAGQQPTAGLGLFVSKNHTRTRGTRCQRSAQARHPTTRHQHIAKSKSLAIVVRVRLARRLTQAAGLTNVVLKKVPRLLGGHEGLVIKASWQKACKPAVHATQVKFDAGLGVNGLCAQAVDQFYLGHARIGHGAVAVKQLHQGIGLLDAGAQNAARAMVFPAARHQGHAIGQQGRGQCVTGQPLKTAAIEGETQRCAALYPPTRAQTTVGGTHVGSLAVRALWAVGAGSPIFQTASKR